MNEARNMSQSRTQFVHANDHHITSPLVGLVVRESVSREYYVVFSVVMFACLWYMPHTQTTTKHFVGHMYRVKYNIMQCKVLYTIW